MAALSALFRWILPYTPACPDPLVETHIVTAARDWCRETRCWRSTETIAVTGTETDIAIAPAGAELFEIDLARFDDNELDPVPYTGQLPEEGIPTQITQASPGTVMLLPAGQAGTLKVSVYLMPAIDADALPDDLINRFGEFIAHGALAGLLGVPGQPYSNPAQAEYFRKLFQGRQAAAFNQNRRGQQRAPVRSRSYGF